MQPDNDNSGWIFDFDAGELINRAGDGFWYVGTPYSKYPGGIEEGFKAACLVTANLIALRVPVYSPIAHTHPIAIHGNIDPLDHEIWLPADAPMMRTACGLLVALLPTWEDSYGLRCEIDTFRAQGKPVLYLDPISVPGHNRRRAEAA